MSKYKPYDVKENRLNLKFKDKDPARANKTKNSRSIRINKEMMASSRKKQTSNGTVEEEAVILSASYIAKLYTYIDDVKSLVYKPLHKQRCKKDIMQKYNLLKTPNHEIICKKHAFRRMKEEMSLQHYLIRCDSNSRTISINGCQLNAYLKAYLYSMVYPPIFEVCDKDYRDVIFSKYPSLLYMWCNMLEDAIVLDAFMLALHNCMKKLLDHGNNIIGYQNENNHLKYDLEWFYKDGIKGKRQSMYNPKNELLKVYFPSIQFACLVDEETAQINKTYGTKRIAKMLDYNFFLYKNKGEQKHLSMVSHVSECVSTWKDLIDFEEKDNNNSCALYSVFALYNLNRTSHLFDFWWHQDFDDVPFHLTEGFMTNYVLHKIMQQGREFISEVVNIPDDQYSYGVYYIHDSALEYSLQYTIEDYDWYFLKSLIRRIGATLEAYDVRYKHNQAAELVGALKTTGNFISDDFIKWIKSELSNEKEPFKDRIRECINNSRSYYELIYNDIYSNKDEISCLFKHKR